MFIDDTFCELPYLRTIIDSLKNLPEFRSQYFVIDSVYSPGTKLFIKHNLKNSIVFYLSNEHHQLPEYSPLVKAIFTPYLPYKNIPSHAFSIPLGCNGDMPEVEFIDWKNRSLDLFFSGQFIDGFDYRERFAMNMEDLIFKQITDNYYLKFTPKFRTGLNPEQYMKTMMQSKIALVPRGYSPITYRLFEAAFCGTVVVCEKFPLPDYLNDFPLIKINHWGELSQTIIHLLSSPQMLESLHQQSLNAYDEKLSANAVANYILNTIKSLS